MPPGANVSVTSFFSSSLKCRTRQRYGAYTRIGRERGESGLAATLQLDKRLHRLVDPERGGGAEVRRAQAPLGRERLRAGERTLTVQADVDGEQREGGAEIAPRKGGRRQRQRRQQHPERRLLRHAADSSAGVVRGTV